MFKIKATFGRKRKRSETIDRAATREEADYLASEYGIAFGVPITVMETGEEKHLSRIAAMRREGLTNSEIAARCSLTLFRVDQLAGLLVQRGIISQREPGKQPDLEVAARNEEIAQLREQGVGPKEIADRRNLPYSTVRAIVHQLRRSGRLPRLT